MTSRSETSSSNRNQGDEQRNKYVSLKKEGSCQSKLGLQIENSFFFLQTLGAFLYYLFENSVECVWLIFTPTPTAPKTLSFHTHQAFNPLPFFVITIKSNLCFPNIVGYVALYKAVVEFPGKTDTPFPCSCQLSLTSQIRVDFMTVSFLFDGVLSDSSLPRSCACWHNRCEFACTAALRCPKDTVPV